MSGSIVRYMGAAFPHVCVYTYIHTCAEATFIRATPSDNLRCCHAFLVTTSLWFAMVYVISLKN